jgi:hypothetical protein
MTVDDFLHRARPDPIRILVSALPIVVMMLSNATPAAAQPAFDHLQCFAIRDRQPRAQYTAELLPEQAPPFSVAPGCRIIVPARYACIDVEKRNVNPPAPLAIGGEDARDYLCYRVHCPRGIPDPDVINFADQFGSRPVQIKRARYLCAPAFKPGVPTRTPTNAPTPTPGGATSTPGGATQTPGGATPTPGPCALTPGQFGTCGGSCPNAGDECLPNGPQCECRSPTACGPTSLGVCDGTCPNPNDTCSGFGPNGCVCMTLF